MYLVESIKWSNSLIGRSTSLCSSQMYDWASCCQFLHLLCTLIFPWLIQEDVSLIPLITSLSALKGLKCLDCLRSAINDAADGSMITGIFLTILSPQAVTSGWVSLYSIMSAQNSSSICRYSASVFCTPVSRPE